MPDWSPWTRPVLDRLSRHRRASVWGLLIGLPVLLILAPLALDLFYAIPWSWRKAAGWMALAALGLLAMRRLSTWRAGDRPILATETTPRRWFDALLPWILQAATASLAWPLLRDPHFVSLGDWDFYLAHFEAARRTIVLWGQFPWWNPWSSGGFPLAANPQIGVVSPTMALVLALGTGIGLRIATIGWMMTAVEGARRLGMRCLGDPWAAALVGLVYGLNGGVLIYAVAGFYVPLSYWVLPWLVLTALHLGTDRRAGLVMGAWLSLAVLNGIHYLLIYGVCVAGLLGWRQASAAWPRNGRLLARNLLLAVGIVLAACGWRLATTLEVLRDYPHAMKPSMAQSIEYALLCWVGRPSPTELAATVQPVFWESNIYVGWLVVALFGLSLFRGWRWWHTLALLAGWLAFGGHSVFHPSYWLSHLPGFQAMHVVLRWRLVAALGVGLGAGGVIAWARRRNRAWMRSLAALAVIAVGLDLVLYGHAILPLAFPVDPATLPDPGLEARVPVQLLNGAEAMPVARGYGIIQSHEPQLGYDRDRPTARQAIGQPGYRGEFWTDRGPIDMINWRPNQIWLNVQPHERVFINQNPGSWWIVNGDRPFADRRCAEPLEPFEVQADPLGRVLLEIEPPSLDPSLWLHVAGLLITGLVWHLGATAREAGPELPKETG